METVILFGSPRRDGNTMDLVGAFAAPLKARGRVRTINLNDINIRPCQGCLTCIPAGNCKINDDMKDIRKYILESDLIVFATPVYWFTVSGQLKIAMDRCLPFLDEQYNSRIKGKKAVTLMTCGSDDPEVCAPALATFSKTFDLLGLSFAGHIEGLGCTEKGALKETYREKARQLAESLS